MHPPAMTEPDADVELCAELQPATMRRVSILLSHSTDTDKFDQPVIFRRMIASFIANIVGQQASTGQRGAKCLAMQAFPALASYLLHRISCVIFLKLAQPARFC